MKQSLTPEQRTQSLQLREDALDKFQTIAYDKYNKGQEEHGGILTDRDCLRECENEVIDLWFYLQSELKKRERFVDKIIDLENKLIEANKKIKEQEDKLYQASNLIADLQDENLRLKPYQS